jgi:hypothetical protein
MIQTTTSLGAGHMLMNYADLPCPPDDVTVWRFMDYTKFVNILQTSSLYFNQLASFKDRYEGKWTKATLECFRKNFETVGCTPVEIEDLVKRFGNADDVARCTFYVSCWHINEHESAAMWELYTRGGEGIAIRCTIGDIRRALRDSDSEIYPAKINYIDYRSDAIPGGNIFCTCLPPSPANWRS